MEVKLFRNAVTGTNSLHLELEYFGHAHLDKTWNGETPPYPTNRLYLPAQGEALLWMNGTKTVMRPGTAYLVPAGVTLQYACEKNAEILYFHFNLFSIDRYDHLYGYPNISALPVSTELFTQLCRCGEQAQWEDILTLKHSLYMLLDRYQKEFRLFRNDIPSYSVAVQDTIFYIRDHLSAKLHLDELAKRRYTSRTTLTELFRKEVGISLGRYIDDQLLAAAQLRLSMTEEPISQISQQLGYSDQSYFSRRFKELCGMTPAEYRKKGRM